MVGLGWRDTSSDSDATYGKRFLRLGFPIDLIHEGPQVLYTPCMAQGGPLVEREDLQDIGSVYPCKKSNFLQRDCLIGGRSSKERRSKFSNRLLRWACVGARCLHGCSF